MAVKWASQGSLSETAQLVTVQHISTLTGERQASRDLETLCLSSEQGAWWEDSKDSWWLGKNLYFNHFDSGRHIKPDTLTISWDTEKKALVSRSWTPYIMLSNAHSHLLSAAVPGALLIISVLGTFHASPQPLSTLPPTSTLCQDTDQYGPHQWLPQPLSHNCPSRFQ